MQGLWALPQSRLADAPLFCNQNECFLWTQLGRPLETSWEQETCARPDNGLEADGEESRCPDLWGYLLPSSYRAGNSNHDKALFFL